MNWISVKDRMPGLDKNQEPIDCELKQDFNGEILTGYYDDGTWWIEAEHPHIGHWNYKDSDIEYKITHWRPKPEES